MLMHKCMRNENTRKYYCCCYLSYFFSYHTQSGLRADSTPYHHLLTYLVWYGKPFFFCSTYSLRITSNGWQNSHLNTEIRIDVQQITNTIFIWGSKTINYNIFRKPFPNIWDMHAEDFSFSITFNSSIPYIPIFSLCLPKKCFLLSQKFGLQHSFFCSISLKVIHFATHWKKIEIP